MPINSSLTHSSVIAHVHVHSTYRPEAQSLKSLMSECAEGFEARLKGTTDRFPKHLLDKIFKTIFYWRGFITLLVPGSGLKGNLNPVSTLHVTLKTPF